MNGIVTYWQNLSQREQRMLLIASVFFFIGILYWGIVQPLQERHARAESRLKAEKSLLTFAETKAAEIESLRKITGGGPANRNQPLTRVVTSSVKQFNLELIRFQPSKDELQVWLKPMPFNTLVNWIDYLSAKYGVNVTALELGKTNTQGQVEVKRLQLGQK
ncbi:general secretion pathway protein GspM [Veronia nyctiphanis]|uniref:Type II secretion system protein M n=1 Tax=Veronia nyctiphanis TaxID=1278244 RepID=A0A4Q0YQ36_9GAMM|nr:type II secretion system protein M [Veronia nyctiphanis]RXJ72665.1 general secretion pathway protein GspM [Veronia nyctiphanis]